MAKEKTAYVCSSCGYDTPKWIGKCPAYVKMDSTQLNVKQLVLETDESDVQLSYRMDMNAFDDPSLTPEPSPNGEGSSMKPGQFETQISGHFGKGDIGLFAEPYLEGFGEAWPKEQMSVVASASGNLKQINVQNLHAYVPNKMNVSGNLRISDPTDDKKMKIENLVSIYSMLRM